MSTPEKIAALFAGAITPDYAYRNGYDAGKNGPTMANCSFRLFASPALTAEWERGQRDGKAGRRSNP